jgi:hypothetical protein
MDPYSTEMTDESTVQKDLRVILVRANILFKTCYCAIHRFVCLEHFHELRNSKQAFHFFGDICQTQIAGFVSDGCEGGNEYSQARAADPSNTFHVHDDVAKPFLQ